MKKWLISILGIIGLTATSTTTLISCEKPINNKNKGKDNKPEPTPEPQQPPEDSKWKLIDKKDYSNEIKNTNIIYYLYF